jgi:hypothetical protein
LHRGILKIRQKLLKIAELRSELFRGTVTHSAEGDVTQVVVVSDVRFFKRLVQLQPFLLKEFGEVDHELEWGGLRAQAPCFPPPRYRLLKGALGEKEVGKRGEDGVTVQLLLELFELGECQNYGGECVGAAGFTVKICRFTLHFTSPY